MDIIRILLIEDNLDDARLISSVLEKEIKGVLIKHLDSFELFKEIIRNDNYDLILSDYNCNSFTGFDVVNEIRSRNIEIPIIIITGEHTIETALAAINMHVDDYVIKHNKYIKRLPSIINRVLKKSHLEEIKRNTDITINDTLNSFINLYETSSELIQIVWVDGFIMNVNNAWCKTLEYKNDEVKNMHIDTIVDSEWAIEFKNLMEEIKTGNECQPFEMGLISKSGKKLHMEGYVTRRVENKKLVASHWIMRNITDSKPQKVCYAKSMINI